MKFRYKVEFFLLISFARFAGILRLKNARYLAKPLALIFYYLIPIRKNVVKKNLSLAFPQLNDKEINKLAFENYYSIGISLLEIIAIPYSSRDEIFSMVVNENPDLLLLPKFKESGLILYTAHFGNWELGALYVGLILDNTLHVLAKKQKNELVADWIKKGREKFGNKEILLGSSVRELYKTLKENGSVGIVGDQRGPQDGSRIDFFGRSTSIYTGAASIALKMNVPVVLAIIARRPDNRYSISFEEISYSEFQGTPGEKEIYITQKYINILQKNIEEHPEQYFWMHDIWKY
jgi:KDO2-lipid IV(A) lauroyltransferase